MGKENVPAGKIQENKKLEKMSDLKPSFCHDEWSKTQNISAKKEDRREKAPPPNFLFEGSLKSKADSSLSNH